ncbi:MAG: hypothetical protein ACXACE_08195 [Candidatus Thorarchaeota archaeon]
MEIRGDGSHQTEEFKSAKMSILPSEDIRFVTETKSGFLTLTDRRFLHMKAERDGYKISDSMPLDLVIKSEHKKKDTWQIEYHDIEDTDGSIKAKLKGSSVDYSTSNFKIKHPKDSDVRAFTEVMSDFDSVLLDTLSNSPYSDGKFQPRDYSYLQPLQRDLTKDEIILVNTVFTDRPESDELQGRAHELVGENPYVLWNTAKSAIIFVVGKTTTFYIWGLLTNGILSVYTTSSFEVSQLVNMKSFWMKWNPNFLITKSDLSFGEVKYSQKAFTWEPSPDEHRNLGNWFFDPANAVWILSDMIFDQQREPVKANFASSELIDDPVVRRQRYYW